MRRSLETNIMIKLRSAVRNWYKGKYVAYENDPRSTLVFIGGDYERHWTARVVRVLVEFWQWIVTVGVAPFILKMLK